MDANTQVFYLKGRILLEGKVNWMIIKRQIIVMGFNDSCAENKEKTFINDSPKLHLYDT